MDEDSKRSVLQLGFIRPLKADSFGVESLHLAGCNQQETVIIDRFMQDNTDLDPYPKMINASILCKMLHEKIEINVYVREVAKDLNMRWGKNHLKYAHYRSRTP